MLFERVDPKWRQARPVRGALPRNTHPALSSQVDCPSTGEDLVEIVA
jgi:hypothetical protein